jgi:hypothetical protein
MSKTIRQQKTKGFLDKLALQKRTRKIIRDIKSEDFWMDQDQFYIPSAQI